jgi:hypothetical protein
MRWQQLFADLQAQFDEAEAAAERWESASRARFETGAVSLSDRLRGALGVPVVLRCAGVGRVAGTLTETGVDWLLLDDEHGREVLVATAGVRSVSGLTRRTSPTGAGVVEGRLDLRRAVRALARDRSTVSVLMDDGGSLTGTVDRVGADFCELAEHPADEPRRPGAVHAVHAIALSAISLVVRASALG